MANPPNNVDTMPPSSNSSPVGDDDLAASHWENMINVGEDMTKLGLRMSKLGTQRSRPRRQDLAEIMQLGSRVMNVGVSFLQESPAATIATTRMRRLSDLSTSLVDFCPPGKTKASLASESGSNSENKRIRLSENVDIQALPPSSQFTRSADASPDGTGTSEVSPALGGSVVGEQINEPYDFQHITGDDLVKLSNELNELGFDLASGVAPANDEKSDGSSQARRASRAAAKLDLGDVDPFEPLPFEPLPVEGATNPAPGVAPADDERSDGSSQARRVSGTAAEIDLGDVSLLESPPVEGATGRVAVAACDPASGVAPADDEESDGSSQARRVSGTAAEIDLSNVSLLELEDLPVEGATRCAAAADIDPSSGVAPADDEEGDGSSQARRVSRTAAEIDLGNVSLLELEALPVEGAKGPVAASAPSVAGVATSGFDPDGRVTSLTNVPSSKKNQGQVKKRGRSSKIPYLNKLVANTAPKVPLAAFLQKTNGRLICLCGRGGHNQHHAGNRDYRNVIESRLRGYKPLSRTGKEEFTNSLVREFEDQGRRFFKVNRGDEWEEMNKRSIRRKVSQNFRDACPACTGVEKAE